mmetsp:Transcript_127451/g.360643  ORF Transcript_127451/g.360643 Transcript_127451/m.360643 type:complete len:789 (+) Transcript_127451:685-3051(+)
MQIVLEPFDDRLAICHLFPLRHDLLLQAPLLALELFYIYLQLLVLPVVVLQVRVHRLDLLLHLGDAVVLRVDLQLELPDLVIQDELELLELLVLLLQVVDALLLVRDGLVALLDLLLVRVLVLHQDDDFLLRLPVLLLLLPHVVLLLLHRALEVVVVLVVDAGLPAEADLLVLLLRELLLVVLPQLLHLPVRVLLELGEGLLVLLEGLVLLLDDAVLLLPVRFLEPLEVLPHLAHDAPVLLHEARVVALPLLLLALEVLGELLVPLHFDEHLLLERLLELLGLLRVGPLEVLDVFLILQFHLCFLLPEHLEPPSFSLNLLAVLLLQLGHLLLVVAVAVPELEVYPARQLLDLPLQVQQRRLLVVEEGARHEDLVREAQGAVPVALRGGLPVDVEDAEAAVVPGAEEVLVVVGEADPGHRGGVRLVLGVLAVQREVVAAQGAGDVHLRDAGEERLRRGGEGELAERGVGLEVVRQRRVLHLLQHLVRADDVHRVHLGGRVRGGVHDDAGEVRALLRPVRAPAALLDDVVLVRGAVRARRHQPRVVRGPADGTHLRLVPPQVAHHLAGVGLVDLDRVGVHGREELPAVAEAALAARLDGDLLVGAHVLHEEVHEPELVGEAHDEVEPARVEGDAEGLLAEELAELLGLVVVVPDPHRLVGAARNDQLLPHADVQAQDRPGVEGRQHVVDGRLLRLQHVRGAQRELQELGGARRDDQHFLGGAHRHCCHRTRDGAETAAAGGAVEFYLLRLLEHLLGVVDLLVDPNDAALPTGNESLAKRGDAQQRSRLPR